MELNIKKNTIAEDRITPAIFNFLFLIANAGNM